MDRWEIKAPIFAVKIGCDRAVYPSNSRNLNLAITAKTNFVVLSVPVSFNPRSFKWKVNTHLPLFQELLSSLIRESLIQ